MRNHLDLYTGQWYIDPLGKPGVVVLGFRGWHVHDLLEAKKDEKYRIAEEAQR